MEPVRSVLALIFLLVSAGVGLAVEAAGTEEADTSSSSSLSDIHEEPAFSTGNYDLRIRQLESERGVYDPQLVEALLELGLVYRAQGKNQEAIDVFERALHIERVNSGLYHLGQIRIIELIVESASALQDWDKLGDSLHYLLWVYRRNYGGDEEKLLPELKKVGQLILDAYQSHVNNMPLNHLIEVDDIYDEATDILEAKNNNQEEQIKTLYRTAIVNYHIAHDINSPKVSHWEIRDAMIEAKRAIPDVTEREVKEHFYEQSFFKGKRAIKKIIDIYEKTLPGSMIKYAEVLVFMGDWYRIFHQKRNAMPYYEKAYKVLLENNLSQENINLLFGKPRALKTLTLPGEEIREASSDLSYVEAILDVPSNGWPANIRITKTNPDGEEKLVRRGELAIAGVPFRPRFENGKPVDTRNVTFQYVFDIQGSNGIYLEEGGENEYFLKDVIKQ